MNRKPSKKINPFLVKEATKDNSQTIPVVSTKETTLPQDISLDQKVDRYLIQYEREAIPQSAMFAGLDQPPRATTPPAIAILQENALFKLLFEADDALDLGGAGGDLGGADPAAAGAGGEEAPAEPEQPQIEAPRLNIQKFSSNMARLINNYEVMLDPKTIILNRAYAYILKNYNQQTANEFMVNMKKYYQLTPNNIPTNSANSGQRYFAGTGNLSDGGSIPSGGGITGTE
jgi:hypothetical protein